MTEGERNQLLNRVFAVIRQRASELRESSDFYESSYVAGEIMKLPGYIVPRMDAGRTADAVVITREEFEILWQTAYSCAPKTQWLDDLLERVEEHHPSKEDDD